MKRTISTIVKSFGVMALLLNVGCAPAVSQDTEQTALIPPNQDRDRYLQKLQPDNCTLVMVDYLTGFNPGIKSIDRERYNKNVQALAQLGQIFKLPTIILGDAGGFRGEFYEVIDQYYADSVQVERNTPSAWQMPKFREEVKARGNQKLILAGISIDNCTMLTTLDALAAGYEAYVVVDASGTSSELVEDVAIARLVQAGAVPITWVTLGSELLTSWESPEGPKLGELYAKMSPWGGGEEGSASSQDNSESNE